MQNIQSLLFDFGGCLDSDGIHSRSLFLNQFAKQKLIDPKKDHAVFNEAYTYSDQTVIKQSLIVNSNLLEMNAVMCFYIAKKLKLKQSSTIKDVSVAITGIQSSYLKRNKKTLNLLSAQFQLGIISNFSGNLMTILKEHSLDSYFNFVLDSYHVGFSKPNPTIFIEAIKLCKSRVEKICYIGDNLERDIVPANALGMKTILIAPTSKPCIADYTIASVEELLVLTQSK